MIKAMQPDTTIIKFTGLFFFMHVSTSCNNLFRDIFIKAYIDLYKNNIFYLCDSKQV